MGRSLEGVVALNGLFLLSGLGILWAVRGWNSWFGLLRDAGIAYLLGVSCVLVLGTLVLVAGGGMSTLVILGLCLGVAMLGLVVGAAKGRAFPRTAKPPRLSLPRSAHAYAATAAALIALGLLAAFFRVAELQPMVSYDGWAFWVQKAKAIYFFGGLDEQLFRSLPGPSYPLLVPELQAMDFRFMGSADTVGLALQYWFLFAGFVFAAAALLRPLASSAIVWLFLGLALVTPEIDSRLLNAQADWPLDIFFAMTALCLVRWVRTGERWLLFAYTAMLAAMLATKREGQLLAACLIVGALAATIRRWRQTWPQILCLALLAYCFNIPWRLWWMSRSLTSDAPDGAIGHLAAQTDRIGPALHLVLSLLFKYEMWLVPMPIALVVALLVATSQARDAAVLYLVTSTLAVVGFTWILVSDPNIPIDPRQSQTPIPRVVGSLILLSIVFAPLLIRDLLRDRRSAVEVPALGQSTGATSGF